MIMNIFTIADISKHDTKYDAKGLKNNFTFINVSQSLLD